MVKLNKIYTRTGDGGTTGLGTGERVAKDHPRIAAYGTVDELNAVLGIVRLHTSTNDAAIDKMLERIQNDLFDLGADLCVPEKSDDGAKLEFEPLRINDAQVERLESEIDQLNAKLEPLKSFVLPGGSPAATYLHLARTVCRRAERMMISLSQLDDEVVSDAALKYVNRLSDFLFVASRFLNDLGNADVLWVPGQNR